LTFGAKYKQIVKQRLRGILVLRGKFPMGLGLLPNPCHINDNRLNATKYDTESCLFLAWAKMPKARALSPGLFERGFAV
jgi:hypothetical protein